MRVLPLLSLVSLVACATNPVTGRRELSLVSEAQEIAMGRQELERAQLQTGFYPDQVLERYVAALGMRMAAASERPQLPWEFHVLDDPAVNAFAAPGGFIFVTRGILAYLNSEAELAGVLGHEVGHVTAKHTVQQLSQQQLFQGAFVIGAIARPDLAQGAVGQAAMAGAGLLMLKYGRDDERQSDELGHRYSLLARYDVREMPKTFATLARIGEASGSSGRVPAFLSTHPDPGDRVVATQSWADTVSNYRGLVTNRDQFLDHLDGMVYGADPRQGYFEGNRFLHPELRIQFDIPTGWQSVNQPTRVVAVEPKGAAQVELSTATGTSGAQAAQTFAAQEGIEVTGRSTTTINGFPASTVAFRATTEDGTVIQGQALFIEYRGQVFRMLGLVVSSAASQVGSAVSQSLRSFSATAAGQVFQRVREIDIITLRSNTTVATLAGQSGGAIQATDLAIMNGVETGASIPAGRKIKTVRFR